ncbi:MAG: isoleucine--tRNA ligase [bacterium]
MEQRPIFPEMEEAQLTKWKELDIFKKTLSKSAPKGEYVFYEGPPTANGNPGLHHVEARAFKDVMPRYKTMQGYHVGRKAGWDTHGLPVELQVEKQLGFSGKPDIEKYGIKEFNQKCKESVWQYLEEWKKMTDRIGFWLDLEHPYVTYENDYMESAWWILRKMWDKGLLYKGYKVVPYCPRCGTPLSSHEVAQGYKDDVEDPAVTIKFRIKGTKNDYLLAWTTTPWTLPGNVALAVGEKITYVKVKQGEETFILAKERLGAILPGAEIMEEMPGSKLVGLEYEPLYKFTEFKEKVHYVALADFVSTADGTGIVHTAVMYGVDDYNLGLKLGLPQVHMVGPRGEFLPFVTQFAGKFVKDADKDVIADLTARGLLLNVGTIKHTYPFCWRCDSPLLYYAIDSWYIAMSKLRDELIKNNQTIHWVPEYIKEGRFGEWLRDVKDWAISRKRYWATPLPIWICNCGNQFCAGSVQDLKDRAKNAVPQDLHRLFIDEVILKCEKCGGDMKRELDLIDVWFDSGAMPLAQYHYPFENKELIDSGKAYPAEYISEAIDQTRGWFYTLLAIATCLEMPAPYKNVICLGHLLDKHGKKMSKSKGNVVKPEDVIKKYGADAVRMFFYTVNQPGDVKRFDEKDLDGIVKKVFMILWNVVLFRKMYGSEKVGSGEWGVGSENLLDKWVLAETATLIEKVTLNLEKYEIVEAARLIPEFINNLSTWYVRRSRDRMKGAEAEQVSAILDVVLTTVVKLLAPFTPFLSDVLYKELGGAKESVHLEDWPTAPKEWQDAEVQNSMAALRGIVTKALEARANSKIPVRQALGSLTVKFGGKNIAAEFEKQTELLEILKEEVNVEEIKVEVAGTDELSVELDTNLTPELLAKGARRELVRHVNSLRKQLGLTVNDRVELYIEAASGPAHDALEMFEVEILNETRSDKLNKSRGEVELSEEAEIGGAPVWIGIKKK